MVERHRRVYPAERTGGGWLSILLLLTAAILIAGGFLQKESNLSIVPVPAQTPVPLNEAFDETPVMQEISLPEKIWYALQLGAFDEEKGAREMAEHFVKRGAAGYVWNDGKYRTLAAVYTSREDAQAVRERLSSNHSVETYLYTIPLQPLILRISGMKGQLEILQAAFFHANDLCQSLQRISTELDQQTMNVEEAISALNALADQDETVMLRLEQRFAPPRHFAVEGLIGCLNDYTHFCSTLNEEQSLVEIGMKVKYQTLHTLYLLQSVYNNLNHT